MTLRVGLLGCGGIGARHAGAVEALSDQLTLVACCGRDLAKTRAFAADRQAEAYDEVDCMLETAKLDLLIVALPPGAHAGEVEQAASAGVNLLVEKPIALDETRADAMVMATEAAGVIAAVGFMYRFGDAVRAVTPAATGRIGLFTGSYHCNALHAPWWREGAKSGGQLVEQAIHLIDLVRLYMGEPDSVYARGANLFHRDVPGYDIDDLASVIFGWEDGRVATLTASNIATPGVWAKEWALFGEQATARFTGWNDAMLTPTIAGATPQTIAGTTDPFVAQLADVADAIRRRRQPTVPLREGAATLRLALAAGRSAETGQEVRLSA